MNKQGWLMNDELIQALKEDAEWAHANEWETPITLGDHLDAAADALEAADKREEAQRWIPVSERLPEPEMNVLIWQTYKGDAPYANITIGHLHQEGDLCIKPYWMWIAHGADMVDPKIEAYHRAEFICPGSEFVTHWQALPQPPQKGE